MPRRISRLRLVPLLVVLLTLAAAAGDVSARKASAKFEVASLFFELNNTDGDLGIHGQVDGGTWTSLDIEGPGGIKLLDIASRGRLRTQGLTEFDFESAEPSFDELNPADFFSRFPEGKYDIEAVAQEGGIFKAKVALSHVLAAAPEATVSDQPAAESCDSPDLPEVSGPVLIDWEPVTQSHPDIGKPGPVTISQYQFFLEQGAMKLSLDLPPDITEFEIPESLTAGGGVFKFEIIARTSAGNNTAVESCFRVP
jgi:hypothetical protein